MLITANRSIVILWVNYLGNWLIFKMRNFWNFLNWKFLGVIQYIEWSNVERPGFPNFKTTNIKITKLTFFLYLRIFFFFFLNEIVKFKKFVFFLIWKMIKFPNFNNLENLKKLKRLSNTLSVQITLKNHKK